MAPISMTLRDL